MNSTSTASPSPNSYLPFACLALLASLPLLAAQPTTQPVPQTPSQLYNLTAVHTIHLHFTPDQWQAIEPKSTGRSPFGGPRPGGPGVFGPASFLAPVFMTAADQNRDQKISKDEFHSLADKWFTDWDKEKTAKLTPDQLRAGLNATFTPPGFSPPPQKPPPPPQPRKNHQTQRPRLRNGPRI
ncbi:MAG: hypothetical protein NTU53_02370 [Planctomycetota bacterium]|nr:hypothetical protein [Planctomycetota bacterium]